MTPDEKNIVWATSDQDNLVIELTTDTLYHIQIERDRDIDEVESLIKETIETPHRVVKSIKYADTRIYSKFGLLSGDNINHWLHVPVSFQGMFGSVTSAYPSPTIKAGKIIKVYYKP